MKKEILLLFSLTIAVISCGPVSHKDKQEREGSSMNKNYQVKLITVDPGHFHAALVQKTMYDQVSPEVHVYAPLGPDCDQHLGRINSYNTRKVNPTSWQEVVYKGNDFFEKMISEKSGNVVVLAGNNAKKAEYISKSVTDGLNVLTDKPMIIRAEDFQLLEDAFRTAKEKGVLLYDIMTERYEVTTILQKLLSQKSEIFGTLIDGTKDEPAVSKVSIHHFSKIVSGSPLLRPEWYFDVSQQGEGIVDVTSHLVDLIQWECFPEQILKTSDVEMVSAKRWPTLISLKEFRQVTGFDKFPDFLQKDIRDSSLNVFSNGEMVYRLKGKYAKVSVEWKFQAPPGGGDTHYSVMHGTICDLVIKQGPEEKFRPVLYIENIKEKSVEAFTSKLKEALSTLPYDSLGLEKNSDSGLRVNIPERYRVTHEDHFAQVMKRFLGYLKDGKIPEWETEGMITKYFTTTSALKMAFGKK